MKRVNLVILLLLCIKLFSVDFTIKSHPLDPSLTVKGETLTYTKGVTDNLIEHKTTFKVDTINSFNYLLLSKTETKKLLLLHSREFNLVIDRNNRIFAYGINYNHKTPNIGLYDIFEHSLLYRPVDIEVSSSLKTENRDYGPDNIGNMNGARPWIEGAEGSGIGEFVSFNALHKKLGIHTIIISIGYVDFNNPQIYYEKSRPRDVRIWYNKKEGFLDVELDDNPNPQIINLPEAADDFNLEIVSVYPGESSETCINFILTASGLSDYFYND